MKPAIIQPELPATQSEQSVSLGQVLHAAVSNGITAQNVDVVERILAMQERAEQKQAERDFAQAFHALQCESTKVKAVDIIPDNKGGVRSRFAKFHRIMEQVQPLLSKHGFSVSFDQKPNAEETRVTSICTLTHTSGHSRTNSFTCRTGAPPPGSSVTQGDGGADSFSKRYALCAALNIVVDTDYENDAKLVGDFISKEDAEQLRAAVLDTKSNEANFLKWCKANTYEEIPESMLAPARALLLKRKKEQAKPAGQDIEF